ncbi:hypothetical protein HaLaN_32090, partial [Haematococcus lacustris]
AIHSRRLYHSFNAHSNTRRETLKAITSPVSWVAMLDAKLEQCLVDWEQRNWDFPRCDGLARSRLEDEYADVSRALMDLPEGYRPNPPVHVAARGLPPVSRQSIFARDMRADLNFDLPCRQQFARQLVEEFEAELPPVEADRRLAVRLRELFDEMAVNGANVPQKAGLLLEAVKGFRRWRRHMLRRHMLPSVVASLTTKAMLDVGNAYMSAWVDNDIDSLTSSHPELLTACLDRAVADGAVGTAAWREQLRHVRGTPPPPRKVVNELMGAAWARGNSSGQVPFSLEEAPFQPSF